MPARRLLPCSFALALTALAPSTATAEPTTTDARPPSPPPESPAVATAVVHIQAPPTVSLQWQNAFDEWVLACKAPCDLPLPAGGEYRIAGDVAHSAPFGLLPTQPGQRVVIDVDPASKGAFAGGIVLASAGAAAMAVGSLVWLVNVACGNGNDCASPGSTTGEAAGLVTVGMGAVAIVGGVLLSVLNSRSKAVQHVAGVVPGAPARHDSYLLGQAMWNDAHAAPTPVPPPSTTPIVSYVF